MSESGIQVREASSTDGPAIARVHIDAWRTTYRGIVPDEYLAGLDYEKRRDGWTAILRDTENRTHTFVADDVSHGVVGFASGGPERSRNNEYDGELYAIYVLETYQRKGIGRRLTAALAARLQATGLHALLVWVLADNPAQQFHKALGGSFVMEQDIIIGGATLKEVAYSWNDINTLTNI